MLARLLIAALLLPAAGCMTNTYSSDPNRRILQLMNESEDLRQIEREWEHFWMVDQPAHLTDERIHKDTTAPVPATPESIPVTVANVRKEEVTLFTIEAGTLKFLRKVPAGEAVDIDLPGGANLAATFATAPHCANYAFKKPGEVWLLRPDPVASVPLRFGLGMNADPSY